MYVLKPLLIIAICCGLFCGCEKAKQAKSDFHDGHSHSHGEDGHSHSHEGGAHLHDQETESESDHLHGIHGGHKFIFQPADYVGEWLVTSEDVTKVFVLDSKGEKAEPVKADTFELKRGDTVFALDPVATDLEGRTATYMLADQDLSIAINLGVEVTMQVGDNKYTGKIAAPKSHQH